MDEDSISDKWNFSFCVKWFAFNRQQFILVVYIQRIEWYKREENEEEMWKKEKFFVFQFSSFYGRKLQNWFLNQLGIGFLINSWIEFMIMVLKNIIIVLFCTLYYQFLIKEKWARKNCVRNWIWSRFCGFVNNFMAKLCLNYIMAKPQTFYCITKSNETLEGSETVHKICLNILCEPMKWILYFSPMFLIKKLILNILYYYSL